MTIDPVSLAITAALTAAQMAMTATQKIEGPRLDDLSVTVADYGTPLNYFYGTRRFEGVPIIWAEPLREVKKKRKTKGGKYNEYTYYGTWAVAIAGHEIDAVTRIWFDKHLVYDATGAGPIHPFAIGSTHMTSKGKSSRTTNINLTEHMRIYLGTEDQMPDPRMLATVEAEHGAGSCPAYRGIAYAVFEDIPLEKLGNRIPQITIEATSNAADQYPFDSVNALPSTGESPFLWTIMASADGSRFYTGHLNSPTVTVWDSATRSAMFELTLDYGLGAMTPSGSFYSAGGTTLATTEPDGGSTVLTTDFDEPAGGCAYVGGILCVYPILNFQQTQYYNGSRVVARYPGFSASHYFEDVDGQAWAVGQVGTDPKIAFSMMPNGTVHEVTTGETGDAYAIDPGTGEFFVWQGGKVMMVDTTTWTVTASTSVVSVHSFTPPMAFRHSVPGQTSIWVGSAEYSTSDASILRTVNLLSWPVGELADWVIYDPYNHALLTQSGASSNFVWRYLDRIDGDGVTLGEIADDVAERCGLPVGGYDFSDLDQSIAGYNWTQGSGRDILDPLFTAYDSDIAPHDFSVRGVKRGASSAGTIDVAQFVRDPDRYRVSIVQDADLPRALTFSFADTAAEQQTNSVLVQRPAVAIDGVRELNINMTTLALSVDEARGLAERYFRRIWAGREKIENALTAQYLALEPADVRTLGLDGVDRTARLLEQTLSAGMIKARWERDDPNIALLSGTVGAAMDGREPSVMLVPGLTRGFVVDAPLARDIDDQSSPFMMIAAAPYTSGGYWSGADFYLSDDGGEDTFEAGWATIGPLDTCTWGVTTDALGDALPWIRDDGNSLNVMLRTGELESVSDAEFDASNSLNLALLESADGWEYLRFRTATLEMDGSWTLTGLSRGCRGTEQHIATHAAGDRFLLVDSTLAKRAMSASEIGDTDYYKAVSQGRDETSAYAEEVAFTAAAQKPYSPVHGALTLDGSGDWSIDAKRRTRVGGANIDGQDVPLGETAESWSCDIMDGADIVRTISGSSLPLTYSSAQQTADFGAPQTSLTVNLYQVSPSLSLRGFPLAIAA